MLREQLRGPPGQDGKTGAPGLTVSIAYMGVMGVKGAEYYHTLALRKGFTSTNDLEDLRDGKLLPL